jgi:Uma2 family endonuclease
MTQDEEDSDMLAMAPVLPATPLDGWTLDNLPPDLPKHTQLIRGTLVMSPQKALRMEIVDALKALIAKQCPPEFRVQRGMAIKKSQCSAPEPDLSIIHADAFRRDKSIYLPDEVVLTGEVISPESEERDRDDKPIIYAHMGIPTYWLIEIGEDFAPVAHEHYLDAGVYKLMKTHVGRLTTDVPFSIDIALVDPTV